MHTSSACVSSEYYFETKNSLKICSHPVDYTAYKNLERKRTESAHQQQMGGLCDLTHTSLIYEIDETHTTGWGGGRWRTACVLWLAAVKMGGGDGDAEQTWVVIWAVNRRNKKFQCVSYHYLRRCTYLLGCWLTTMCWTVEQLLEYYRLLPIAFISMT